MLIVVVLAVVYHRIQSMGRSLERRAEGIKGFFDSEIRKVPPSPPHYI